MQTKEELDDWYKIPDRWKYFTNEDDKIRKEKLLGMLPNKYLNALDIGCGECFVTRDLPAYTIHGIELSDVAASRFPSNVVRVHGVEIPKLYDLVVSTGTLYPQYDHQAIYKTIMEASNYHILIAGIKDWLIDYDFGGKIVYQKEFAYQGYTQKATLYRV